MSTKQYSEISQEVICIISEHLQLDRGSVSSDSNIIDLSNDSIQLFELLTAFQDFYGVSVEYDDVVNLHTVSDVVDYIARVKYGVEKL